MTDCHITGLGCQARAASTFGAVVWVGHALHEHSLGSALAVLYVHEGGAGRHL